jgi:hypothetical protein
MFSSAARWYLAGRSKLDGCTLFMVDPNSPVGLARRINSFVSNQTEGTICDGKEALKEIRIKEITSNQKTGAQLQGQA